MEFKLTSCSLDSQKTVLLVPFKDLRFCRSTVPIGKVKLGEIELYQLSMFVQNIKACNCCRKLVTAVKAVDNLFQLPKLSKLAKTVHTSYLSIFMPVKGPPECAYIREKIGKNGQNGPKFSVFDANRGIDLKKSTSPPIVANMSYDQLSKLVKANKASKSCRSLFQLPNWSTAVNLHV